MSKKQTLADRKKSFNATRNIRRSNPQMVDFYDIYVLTGLKKIAYHKFRFWLIRPR